MRVLLDTCVWGGAVRVLETQGHDVIWVGNWQADPGDREILRQACDDERILVTLDKDFGERAVVMGEPHAGIVRLAGIAARKIGVAAAESANRPGNWSGNDDYAARWGSEWMAGWRWRVTAVGLGIWPS